MERTPSSRARDVEARPRSGRIFFKGIYVLRREDGKMRRGEERRGEDVGMLKVFFGSAITLRGSY